MDTRYATHKVAWHLDRIADLRAGRTPAPIMLQVVLSDLCNQDCAFCSYRASNGRSTELFAVGEVKNPNRKIATPKALELVEDGAELGVRSIEWTGGGEPTVHPDHERIFARGQELGIAGGLITNGVRLDPRAAAILGMTWIRVSIDAGDVQTYAQIRRVRASHWRKLWQNLEALAGRYAGALSASFVVTRENYATLEALALRLKAAGIPSLRVTALFTTERDPYHGRAPALAQEIAALKAKVDGDGFELQDLFTPRVSVEHAGAPTRPLCAYQYLKIYIGADLNVYRCCHIAYTGRGLVGSLRDSRLRDLHALAFEPFDARGCGSCHWREQNELINDLIEEPMHADFI